MSSYNLRVISAGKIGKIVVLLSGGGLDNALLSWKHLIAALSSSYRVFALDWPKQGKSSPWNRLADHECLIHCLDVLLNHYKLDKVNLVGLSQGGAITLAYTLTHPQRIGSFVALAPGGIIRFPIGYHQLLWLFAKLPWLTSGILNLLFQNRKIAQKSLKAMFPILPQDFENIVDDVLEEAAVNGVGASDWQNNSIGFRNMKIYLTPQLHKITCPALFIQGDKDMGVKPKYTIEAAKQIPHAKLVMLENHGHWSNRQSPEKVNAIILDFLDMHAL